MAEPVERIAADLLGTCPLPRSLYDRILLGHGSGGLLSAELIQRVFMPAFDNDVLSAMEDQATVRLPSHGHSAAPRIAITTDSFVVRPLFFPGGDIGKLAVHGTVNDLAVGGAKPLFLTAAFILEEGLEVTTLERIVTSMREACDEAEIALVAGDTKVVDRGKADQIFIVTTGVGWSPRAVRCRSAPLGPATGSLCRARWATTASRSCRCEKASNSKPYSRATPPRSRVWYGLCLRNAQASAPCAIQRAEGCRAP